ncbi:hypothetical protein CEXT_586271 [Caerostris extrusa]|uniref:Uncharacterized protein n=1 Tax=Caerostris extrusa TaxID=172846 RepID=A0AAV4WB55_CAEEX|nr:hypothetical protein CEXT_586271 [Caerostris extrusa]
MKNDSSCQAKDTECLTLYRVPPIDGNKKIVKGNTILRDSYAMVGIGRNFPYRMKNPTDRCKVLRMTSKIRAQQSTTQPHPPSG